jgi:hypothetical protein
VAATVENFGVNIGKFHRLTHEATLVALVNPSIGIIGIYLISFIISTQIIEVDPCRMIDIYEYLYIEKKVVQPAYHYDDSQRYYSSIISIT